MKIKEKYFFNKIVKKLFFTTLWLFFSSLTMAQAPKIKMIVISDTIENGKFVQHSRPGFDSAQINATLQKYLMRYVNNGYPFAKTVCDSVVLNPRVARFFFSVQKGKHYKIENILLPGNPKITSNYIYRTIHLKPGAEFSHRKIMRADALVNSTGILATTRQTQTEFHPDDADIFLYIQKLKCNSAEAGLALMYDETRQRYYPTGNAQLRLANVLGKGETFDFEWHGYKENSQKLSTEIRLPYLFKTAMSAGGRARIDKTDSTCVLVELNPMLEFALSDMLSVKTDAASTWLIPQNGNTNVSKTSSTLYGGDLLWLGIWNNGIIKTSVGAAIGKRTFNNEKTPCQELRLSIHLNHAIIPKLELDVTAESKAKFCDQETDLHEKYRFGGAKSLRGFAENYFYADRYVLISNTLRYRPYKSFSLFALYDVAAYRCQSTNDTPQGAGIGAGVTQRNTEIDIAWALGREYGETLPIKQAKLHITVKVNF